MIQENVDNHQYNSPSLLSEHTGLSYMVTPCIYGMPNKTSMLVGTKDSKQLLAHAQLKRVSLDLILHKLAFVV